jgi:hypothetical protein
MTKFKMFRDMDFILWELYSKILVGDKNYYNNGQKERLCLIIDKCRRQKLCKRAQKISAAAPLRVMASR